MLQSEKLFSNLSILPRIWETQGMSFTIKQNSTSLLISVSSVLHVLVSVADLVGCRGATPPPGPVKISHKKDGHRRSLHRFHVYCPPPLPGRWIRY